MTHRIFFVNPGKNNVPTLQAHNVSPNVLCSSISRGVSFNEPTGAAGTSSTKSYGAICTKPAGVRTTTGFRVLSTPRVTRLKLARAFETVSDYIDSPCSRFRARSSDQPSAHPAAFFMPCRAPVIRNSHPMRLTPRRLLAVAVAFFAAAPFSTFASTAEMTAAAKKFLAALDPAQTAKAVLTLTAPEREKWFFTPVPRDGLTLKAMTAPQQELARALLRSGLSQRGAARAETIITLENVLREIEKDPVRRDPSLYYVTIFGDPAKAPWGWRFEGHHLSLNFTIFDANRVAITPSFFGTNPAEVRDGPMQGTRVLAEEEDLGFALVNSLDAAQRAVAVIAAKAPNDIFTSNKIRVEPLTPAGITASTLTAPQREQLRALLQLYFTRYRAEIADPALAAATASNLDGLTFAWAGALDRGPGHYYRIQGKTFVVEFDNTQNNANHVHTVWRNFDGDFGRDLLGEHYARDHAKKP